MSWQRKVQPRVTAARLPCWYACSPNLHVLERYASANLISSISERRSAIISTPQETRGTALYERSNLRAQVQVSPKKEQGTCEVQGRPFWKYAVPQGSLQRHGLRASKPGTLAGLPAWLAFPCRWCKHQLLKSSRAVFGFRFANLPPTSCPWSCNNHRSGLLSGRSSRQDAAKSSLRW